MKTQWYRIVDIHESDAYFGKGKFNDGDIIQVDSYHPDTSGEYKGYGSCEFKKKHTHDQEWHSFFRVKLIKATS